MADITVIGGINIDIEGSPFNKLRREDSNPGRISLSYGGVGRNITENIARIGGDVAMVSVIGEDQMGRGAKEELQDLGVDVSGVEILSIGETAGLGMKAKEASFRGQYTGKTTELFTVTKNEPAAEGEIQALSGATITSRAMTNAVTAALTTARSIMGE